GLVLHASLEGPDPAGTFSVEPASAPADHLGRAVFTVRAPAPGQAELFVGDAEASRGARLRLTAAPCAVEVADAAGPLALSPDDEHLLRQLFGPGHARIRVARRFEAGRSGALVLLVRPYQTAPGGELRGQPCIVKLGERRALVDEWQRHQRW